MNTYKDDIYIQASFHRTNEFGGALERCPRENVLQMVEMKPLSHVASFTHYPRFSYPSLRLNTKLEANDYPPMESLVRDLSDGVRLIQLMVRLWGVYGEISLLNTSITGDNGSVRYFLKA